ncbi:glycosyltransferase [Flavobacterium granuli]|uniref:Rhamnosyltransferase n=1 Tax=Flavobacterium granuli TaxID=280093 RepID=A0ABU1S5X1_9FLAO|nr:glycosyltransferase [Flavobacterium granuli]MDR6846403.1 rhamnosyltransferase [Flavobacterium granuli]
MRILVVLASYNGEKYIKEQLDSLLSQEEVDVTIIVFDDVSNDGTVNEVNTYNKDERVRLIINESPTGSAANNFFGAIKFLDEDFISQYDFVSFADQDDIWLPNKLRAATEKLTGENSSLYLSNLILWNEKTNKKSIINKSFPQKRYDYLFEGGSAGCTYVFTSDFCINLKSTLAIIDYENWKFFSHDWFVYFFARVNNYQVSIDNNAFILYRIHDNNVHGQLNSNSFFAFTERLKLVHLGWYIENIKGFVELLPKVSKERDIYELYSKNVLTRLFVLFKYNFSLMRSTKKFIQFFVVSLLPIRLKK